MPDLGQAYVQIVPSAEGISGSISNVLKPEASSAGDTAGAIAGEGMISATTAAIAAGAVVVAAAVGETLKIAAETAEYGDTIDKQSQKIGVSNQAYQEWSFILQHCGTDIGTMQRGMKALNSAAESNADAFGQLGLSMDEVNGMSQEDLFSTVISRLQDMEPGLERNALANDLLGRSYQDLQPLLNTTAEETEAMRQSFSDLGGMMSDEAVADSARYQDSLLDMQTAFAGIKRALVSNVVPALATGMSSVAKFVTQSSFIDNAKVVFEKLGQGIKTIVMPAIDSIKPSFNALKEAMQPVIIVVADLWQKFTKANGQFRVGKAIGSALAFAIKALGVYFRYVATAITTVIKVIKTLVNAFKAVKNGFTSVKAHITSAITTIGQKFSSLRDKITRPFKSAYDKVKGIIDKLKKLFPLSVGKIMSNLKVPKISVSGGKIPYGIGGLGTAPKISVKWNAQGGIFNSASIIGYGVGEAGQEAIVPLDPFWNKLDSALSNNNNGGVLNLSINLDGSTIAQKTINYINGQTVMFNTSPI